MKALTIEQTETEFLATCLKILRFIIDLEYLFVKNQEFIKTIRTGFYKNQDLSELVWFSGLDRHPVHMNA